jgi:BlaI family transcriptional regulator, penicillinase repressor
MESRDTPTPAELEILRVLWQRGPSTVREVHELIERSQPVGYTTVLKMLQIMFEKEMVSRDEAARAHVYTARVAAEATERRLLDDLKERAFGGSTARLVLRALSDAPVSEAELSEVRALLDQFESGRGGQGVDQ